MIQNNRVSKYLLYAIGEIILVVIGILIALQINTWNQQRIQKVRELKILKEIREGLGYDLNDLETNASAMQRAQESAELIMKQLENNLPYHDSLSLHFSHSLNRTRFINKDGPFEFLKSQGMELISNDSLRIKITDVYDAAFQSLREWETGFFIQDMDIARDLVPYFDQIEHFKLTHEDVFPGKMVPHNFESLRTDEHFKTLFRTLQIQNRYFMVYTEMIKTQVAELREDISQEIRTLEEDY